MYAPGTDEPFTVAVCSRDQADIDSAVLEQLRAAVRRCPHGVLVVSRCLLGQFGCATHCSGVTAVLQPCWIDRTASGPALWVGPLAGDADARTVHEWVVQGAWQLSTLPAHLMSAINLRMSVRGTPFR
jgi:hypothetical protein